jgi:hypothetical protein
MQAVTIRPPNSLLLVMDAEHGEVPLEMRSSCISTTASCVAIGCLMEQDGPTLVELTTSAKPDGDLIPVFDGVISTPRSRVGVCSVTRSVYLETLTRAPITRIRVFVNDEKEPDHIVIVVGE